MSKTLRFHVGPAKQRDLFWWPEFSRRQFPRLAERMDDSDNLRATKFNRARLYMSGREGDAQWIDVRGEFYVVMDAADHSDIVDESGDPFRIDSFYIPGLSKNNFLALKGEGKCVLFLDHVEDFVDIYMVVMKSAAKNPDLGSLINAAGDDSHFALFLHRHAE